MTIKRLLGSILVAAVAVVSFFGIEESKLALFPTRANLIQVTQIDGEIDDFRSLNIEKRRYIGDKMEEYDVWIKNKEDINEIIENLEEIELLEVASSKFRENSIEIENQEIYYLTFMGRTEDRISDNEVYIRDFQIAVNAFKASGYIEVWSTRGDEEKAYFNRHYKIEEGNIDYNLLDQLLTP